MKEVKLNSVSRYTDFYQMLTDVKNKYSKDDAVTCYSRRGEPCVYSYENLFQDTIAFRSGLEQRNLQGKNIAIVGENSYQWLVAYLGIIISGGVAVCVDIEQSDEAIVELIGETNCKAIFASESIINVIEKCIVGVDLSNVFSLGKAKSTVLGFNDFVIYNSAPDNPKYILSGEMAASIIFTSGTTVKPKPVILTHKGILTNVCDALSIVTPCKKAFACLPFYHAYGMTCSVLSSIIAGLGMCINGNLKTMLKDMMMYKPGTLVIVPLIAESIHKMLWIEIEKQGFKGKVEQLLKLYRFLGKPKYLREKINRLVISKQFPDLKMIICGGAYLSQSVSEDLTDLGIDVIEGYGITECSPLVTVNQYPDNHSVGYPLPNVKIKIIDDEILVKTASIMEGYYNNHELTNESFDGQWFKTGDLGYINKEGKLVITGRKKNIIVLKNGKKISSEEIESYFSSVSIIKELVAYGALTGDSADDVKLSIMVYPDPEKAKGLTSYEILDIIQSEVDIINKRLPVYKQIQMINLREQEFEKTSSKKIKRQLI